MDGTTEGSVAASRPAATRRPRLAVEPTVITVPADGEAEVEQNMAPRVMPTSADMAGAAVFLASERARTSTDLNPLWANAASPQCLDRACRDVELNHAKTARRKEHP